LRILAGLLIFLLGCPPPNTPDRDVILQDMEELARTGLNFLGEVFWLAPNSTGSFVVQVTSPSTGLPIPKSEVTVRLVDPDGGSTDVYAGISDEQGLVRVTFTVPEEVVNPNQVLVVESNSSRGKVVHEEPVYVGRAYNILVSTDKPVYQPGQTIHVRGLALDSLALKPAGALTMTVTVADPAGNKVFRRELTTSAYGVAAVDFPISSHATSGDYVITAAMGPVESTRTVEVKPYNLPRFKVEFAPDRDYYLPGETASGEVRAHYFFGKPVTGGAVTITAYATDVERFQVHQLTGATDDDGVFRYEFPMPDYFVGRLDNTTANLDLEITVTDTANHPETVDESLTVAEQTLLIDAVPESGLLRPGVENIVYLDVTYPDGRAAPATLTIAADVLSDTFALAADANGLAEFRFTPPAVETATFVVTATTAAGETIVQPLSLASTPGATTVLLRPDRAEYRIGDAMNLDIFVAGNVRTVYLDVIKGRQTFALVPLPVTDGVAHATIDIDGSLLGTLELNAYVVADRGEIIRDRRLVLVNPAPATVAVETDAESYRPGETATISLKVDRDGAPLQGVLGVAIVDESVFSVDAQEPGFARTYFLLERELLEPRYEIHGFTGLDEEQESPYDDNPDSYRITQAPAALPAVADSRNRALMGFFAQELAVMQPVPAAKHAATTAPVAASAWGWIVRAPLMLPLLGLALYNGARSRRRILLGLVLLALILGAYTACSAPAAAPAVAPAPAAQEISETTATRGQESTPRLRQFFPETLYWQPEVQTDGDGHATLQVPLADSITTWRISVLASDAEGNLGSGEASLKVFQEFFIEPDLPRFLTVGDEIDVPVSLYNYLDEAQTIQLSISEAPWFELRDAAVQSVSLAPNEVRAAYVPIRVLDFGLHDFQITARGPYAADAVQRTVEVLPDGAPRTQIASGRLSASQIIPINIPAHSVPGASRITVRLYPGIVAQAVAGLEGMLQYPNGCFEQTSSTNYPNTLILDYLRATGQTNPDLELRAEYLINLGYQRLLTFEVPGYPGGFSLFGDPLPETMLTAFGLMQFADINRVSYVDPALLARTADFLIQRQQPDGSWNAAGMQVTRRDKQAQDGDVPTTAYLVWALADAGYADSPAVARGLDFIAQTYTPVDSDPYVLAIVTNAYVAAGEPADDLLKTLASQAIPVENDAVMWRTAVTTWLASYGEPADLETTAMATIALLRGRRHLDVAEAALAYIASQRSVFGNYHTTQATVLSLKALLLGAQSGGEGGDASVAIALNGGRTFVVDFAGASTDVVKEITFDDLTTGPGEITIEVEGSKAIQYQVNTEYVLPWADVKTAPPGDQAVAIDVTYDRHDLRVNDTVRVNARIMSVAAGTIGTLLVDVGIPPGFVPLTDDLDELVAAETVDRYELTGRQIIFYLTNVSGGEVIDLPYRLQARYPIRAQTPPSTAYDYYTPNQQDTEPPQRVTVILGTPN
jgi:uncharacterized protein YfaS (alpha-2-macroglobulin family)